MQCSRRLSRLCDKRMQMKLKVKIYKTIARHVQQYRAEVLMLRKKDDAFGNNGNENVEADQWCDTKGRRERNADITRDMGLENIAVKSKQVT